MPTIHVLDWTSFTTILSWKHCFGNKVVQSFETAMDVDSLANFLLQERLDKVDDGVNNRRNVDHMHLLQFDGVGFLHTDQELLDQRWGELGKVGWSCHCGIQNINISCHSGLLLEQTDVSDHHRDLHCI